MQQQHNTIQEANEYPETSEQIPSPESQQRVPRQRKSHYFIRLTPEKQQEAFFAWLPKELHDAPGIDWTKLSPDIMRYCISTIENSPDAPVLAIAAASLHGAPVSRSSQQSVRDLSLLF